MALPEIPARTGPPANPRFPGDAADEVTELRSIIQMLLDRGRSCLPEDARLRAESRLHALDTRGSGS